MKTAIEIILVTSFFVAFSFVCFEHFESNETGGSVVDSTSSDYANEIYENVIVPQGAQ
jgi:hypothetical protein